MDDNNEWVVFNLNDKIKVRLKEKGMTFYRDRYNQYLPEEWKKNIAYFDGMKDKDGYLEFQAWEFIRFFGESIEVGRQPIFETNILICKKDLDKFCLPLPPKTSDK